MVLHYFTATSLPKPSDDVIVTCSFLLTLHRLIGLLVHGHINNPQKRRQI